jgi:hypothetical protein
VPARRSNPYPPILDQQTLSKWNRAYGLIVCQSRPYLTAGEPPSAAEDTPVGIWGLEGLGVKCEGSFVKVQNF